MSDPRPDTGSTVLDRAITSLRDGGDMAEGFPETMARRTAAALWTAEVRTAQMRSRWVMGITAAIVIGICAVATTIVMLQGRQLRMIASRNLTPAAHVEPIVKPLPADDSVDPATDPSIAEAPLSAQPPVSVAAEVMVTGHVYMEGPPPARKEIDISGNPIAMAAVPGPIYDDSIVVNRDGSLANVVVSISGPLPADHEYPSPPPVMMDQRYCMFSPHVVAATIGQQLVVRNRDHLAYYSHAFNSATAIGFNSPVAGTGPRMIDAFPATDTFEVRSDLFPWMHAWVRVLDNPFFDVTRGDGSFTIKDLPAGKYTIHAWHEVLGEREKEITVSGGEPLVVDFAFEGK